jgi:hypothetical protein
MRGFTVVVLCLEAKGIELRDVAFLAETYIWRFPKHEYIYTYIYTIAAP